MNLKYYIIPNKYIYLKVEIRIRLNYKLYIKMFKPTERDIDRNHFTMKPSRVKNMNPAPI